MGARRADRRELCAKSEGPFRSVLRASGASSTGPELGHREGGGIYDYCTLDEERSIKEWDLGNLSVRTAMSEREIVNQRSKSDRNNRTELRGQGAI